MPTSELTRGMTPGQRYQARIEKDPETGCWNWIGSDQDARGYSRFYVEGRRTLVHRWSYEYHVGPIPDGWTVHHKCVNPKCSNPDHLAALSQRDNLMESDTARAAVRARQTECIRGHSLAVAYINPTTGYRKCRECGNERMRRYNAAKRLRRAQKRAA